MGALSDNDEKKSSCAGILCISPRQQASPLNKTLGLSPSAPYVSQSILRESDASLEQAKKMDIMRQGRILCLGAGAGRVEA